MIHLNHKEFPKETTWWKSIQIKQSSDNLTFRIKVRFRAILITVSLISLFFPLIIISIIVSENGFFFDTSDLELILFLWVFGFLFLLFIGYIGVSSDSTEVIELSAESGKLLLHYDNTDCIVDRNAYIEIVKYEVRFNNWIKSINLISSSSKVEIKYHELMISILDFLAMTFDIEIKEIIDPAIPLEKINLEERKRISQEYIDPNTIKISLTDDLNEVSAHRKSLARFGILLVLFIFVTTWVISWLSGQQQSFAAVSLFMIFMMVSMFLFLRIFLKVEQPVQQVIIIHRTVSLGGNEVRIPYDAQIEQKEVTIDSNTSYLDSRISWGESYILLPFFKRKDLVEEMNRLVAEQLSIEVVRL